MWLKRLGTSALFLALGWAGPALAQVSANHGFPVATNLAVGHTNLLFLFPQPGNTAVFTTNLTKGLASRLSVLKSASPTPPKPGVYTTEPFTCIVIVPPKQPDDQSVMKPKESGSAMPVIKPDLRFIPLPSK
jgi:hypothetical protein